MKSICHILSKKKTLYVSQPIKVGVHRSHPPDKSLKACANYAHTMHDTLIDSYVINKNKNKGVILSFY